MSRLKWFEVSILLVCIAIQIGPIQQSLHACNWDTETLLQERSRFPTALEIIVGKFPRHTQDYYQWRLGDRLEKLRQSPTDDQLLDDIAVSYEKLGRYEEAIEVAKQQLQTNPLRYESLANLGTFLIHSGRYREGLEYIKQAIEVNPDAHFGREKYQVILVEYILSRTKGNEIQLPLASERFEGKRSLFKLPFCEFLQRSLSNEPDGSLPKEWAEDATTGILGMMRFSRHDSPILLEVLGELQEMRTARQLAYRAYLSASLHADDPRAKERYRELASNVLDWSRSSWKELHDVEVSESEIEEDFAAERADANAWFASLKADEQRWIAEGKAVDVRFNEKYRDIPKAITTDPETEREREPYVDRSAMNSFVGSITACVILVLSIGMTCLAYLVRLRGQAKVAG